jgi:hypothetical protein
MLKFCVEQWDKNKGKLEQDIINNLKEYNDYSYKELIKKVVALVINDKDSDYGDDWDSEHITEIDNGDYQGTLLYMIPLKTYQPAEYDYLMTYVGYGSCSGCDTLQAIQMWYWDDKDVEQGKKVQFIRDMMSLCKDLVQNIIKPYNYGWRSDDKYIQIEENEE